MLLEQSVSNGSSLITFCVASNSYTYNTPETFHFVPECLNIAATYPPILFLKWAKVKKT